MSKVFIVTVNKSETKFLWIHIIRFLCFCFLSIFIIIYLYTSILSLMIYTNQIQSHFYKNFPRYFPGSPPNNFREHPGNSRDMNLLGDSN